MINLFNVVNKCDNEGGYALIILHSFCCLGIFLFISTKVLTKKHVMSKIKTRIKNFQKIIN